MLLNVMAASDVDRDQEQIRSSRCRYLYEPIR